MELVESELKNVNHVFKFQVSCFQVSNFSQERKNEVHYNNGKINAVVKLWVITNRKTCTS